MNGRLAIRSSEIHAAGGVVDGHVIVAGRRVESVARGDLPEGWTDAVIDVRPHRILPGLIDLHVHGAGGWSVESADAGHIIGLARVLASRGVTAFQPSALALPTGRLLAVAGAVAEAMGDPPEGGARILGLHAEGPYLSQNRPGAMNPRFFRDPSRSEVRRIRERAPGVLQHLTLAPERAGAVEFVRWLAGPGDVVVAGGHTDATFHQASAGIDAGIRLANHTYNAMRGLHQRDPGALGAFALDDRVTCELIADGRHVHPGAMELLIRVAGPDRVALVSDAVAPAGLPPGEYDLFDTRTRITEDGSSVFPDGTLAGSGELLLQGVRNVVDLVGRPLSEALRMASANPARMAGVEGSKGTIAPGMDADLVAVSQGWDPVWTLVEGRVAFGPDGDRPRLNPDAVPAAR